MEQTSQTGGNAVADKRVDFQYNKLGQFTSIERFADLAATQSVVLSTYSYDQAHRLTGLSHAQDTTTLADYGWTYDKLNRVTSFTSLADGTATYTYDDTSQVTSALYDYQSNEDFGYDLAGNRTGGGYTTGTNNRLLSDGTYNYTYDDEGNLGTIRDLAQYDDATGITSIANHLTYDSFGQVTSETNSTIDHLFAYKRLNGSLADRLNQQHHEQILGSRFWGHATFCSRIAKPGKEVSGHLG